MCRTVSIGMANPTPAEEPVGVKMAVLTPMTRPALSSRGPPELPGLMLASEVGHGMGWRGKHRQKAPFGKPEGFVKLSCTCSRTVHRCDSYHVRPASTVGNVS